MRNFNSWKLSLSPCRLLVSPYRRHKLSKWLQLVLGLGITLNMLVVAKVSAAQGPNPANLQGKQPYVPMDGDQIESVDTSTGNLHIEIPIYSETYRGHQLEWKYVYDAQDFSATWVPQPDPSDPNAGFYMIQNINNQSTSWRLVSPFSYVIHYDLQTNEPDGTPFICQFAEQGFNYGIYSNFSVSDPTGAQHPLNIVAYIGPTSFPPPGGVAPIGPSPCGAGINILQSPTLDGSGMYYDVTTGILRLKDGTQVLANNTPINPGSSAAIYKDTNGNGLPAIDPTIHFYDAEGNSHTLSVQMTQVPIVESDCTLLAQQGYIHDTCHDSASGGSQIEVSSITFPNGQAYTFTYNQSGHAEMVGLTMPTGASVSYGYGPMYFDNNATRYSNQNYHAAISTRKITSDGVTLPAWQYNVTGAFGNQPTVKDPSGNCTTYGYLGLGLSGVVNNVITYNGCDTNSILKTVHTDYAYEVIGGNGCSYATQCNNVRPIRVTTTLENGLSSKVETDYETFSDDAALVATRTNPTEIREYDYGATSPTRITDYTYLHNTGNVAATSAQYTSLNIVDRPATKKIMDGSRTVVAQTQYEYDNYTVGIAGESNPSAHDDANFGAANRVRGNLTAVSVWDDTSNSWLTTRYQYDILGNIVSMADPKGNSQGLSYADSFSDTSCVPATGFLYSAPTQITNAKSQITNAKYSSCTGLLKQVQGANDIAAGRAGTTYTFDSVSNLINVAYPDGGRRSYSFNGYANPLTITSSVYLDGLNPVSTSTQLDGRGRNSLTTNPYGATSSTVYDASGRVLYVTNFSYSTPSPTDGATSYTYDALDRPIYVCNPDNGTPAGACVTGLSYKSYSYSGNITTSTDELGNQWQRTTDAFGRLTKVLEPTATSRVPALETDYTYYTLNGLHTVNQIGTSGEIPRPRTFLYDSLSRLKSASNPESGTQTYLYLNAGTLCAGDPSLPCSKTDARGATISYTYDALNRVLMETGSDVNRSYIYDVSTLPGSPTFVASNPIGRLVQAIGGPYTENIYSYDAMGRPIANIQCFVGGCGTVLATYDLVGNITTLQYPSGRTISQTFDSAGRLGSVKDGLPSNPGTPYFTATAYWPSGALQSATLGNGVTENVTLNSRLQPCHIFSSTPALPQGTASNLIDQALFHSQSSASNCLSETGNNGNIWGIVDNQLASRSQLFSYDSLNRLHTAYSADSVYNHTYNYDSFGNMTLQDNLNPNSSIVYQPDPATNRMLRSHVGNVSGGFTDFAYDAAGNLAQSNDGMSQAINYNYDSLSQISSISGGASASYSYYADGNRSKKQAGTSSTGYIYFNGQPLAEYDQNGYWSDYIYANGTKIAKVDQAPTLVHVHVADTSNDVYRDALVDLAVGNSYIFKQGDVLAFRQLNLESGVCGGMNLWLDGTDLGHINDQNGLSMEDNTVTGANAWQNRIFDLSSAAGNHINGADFNRDACSLPGTSDLYFSDIAIISTDGTVTPIFADNSSVSLNPHVYGPTTYITSFTAAAEKVTDPNVIGNTSLGLGVHYYLGDQVGTNQMILSSAGWPIWRGRFTPFGQEIISNSTYNFFGSQPSDNTDNHYKFTGKERDNESGLDYFGARYYASSMGRWMSPDWADKPEAVPYSSLDNPQSLNLFGYVGNNPLSRADADGHCDWCHKVAQIWRDGVQAVIGQFKANANSLATDPNAGWIQGMGMLAGAATPVPEFGGSSSVTESVVAPTIETESATSTAVISDAALSSRATAIQGAQDAFGQTKSTTAAASVTDANGNSSVMIGSSRNALTPSQRAALQPGETAVTGVGHAETTVINAAQAQGMKVNAVAASRPVCPTCSQAIQDAGARQVTPSKPQ